MQLTLVDPTAIITWLTQNGLKVKNDLSPVLTELNVRCVLDLASLDIEGTNKVVSVMKNLQQKKWSKCKVPEKLAAILTTAIDEANKKITVEEWLQVLALSDSGTADWLEEEGYEDMEDLMELEEEEMEKLITAAKKNGGEAHAKRVNMALVPKEIVTVQPPPAAPVASPAETKSVSLSSFNLYLFFLQKLTISVSPLLPFF